MPLPAASLWPRLASVARLSAHSRLIRAPRTIPPAIAPLDAFAAGIRPPLSSLDITQRPQTAKILEVRAARADNTADRKIAAGEARIIRIGIAVLTLGMAVTPAAAQHALLVSRR